MSSKFKKEDEWIRDHPIKAATFSGSSLQVRIDDDAELYENDWRFLYIVCILNEKKDIILIVIFI